MRNKSLAKHPMVQRLIKLGVPRRKARRMVIEVLSRPVECNVNTHATFIAAFCTWSESNHGEAWCDVGIKQARWEDY